MAIVLHLIYASVALVGLGLAVQSLTAKKLTNVQTMANVSDLTSAIVLMDIRAEIVMLLLTAVILGIAMKTDFAYSTRNWKVFASKHVLIIFKNSLVIHEEITKQIDVRKILYKIIIKYLKSNNEHRILYKIVILANLQLNEKAKTTNNGAFLKLFKTLTARVLSSLKIIGLRPRTFKLDKTLLFVF